MKVSVLGAGAIGSMLGGLIAESDPTIEVVLVSRGDHGEFLQEHGRVTLEGPWETKQAKVVGALSPEAISGSDFVLITVKGQATQAIIDAAAPYLGDAIVVSVQNGFNDEALLRQVAPEKLVMGITATNVSVPQPGTASLKFVGTIVLGPNEGKSNQASAKQAVELLQRTGFRCFQEKNIQGVRYNKLAINSPGYAASLSASNFITEAVCHGPWRRAVGAPLAQECIDIFEHAGVELASIPKLPDIAGLNKFFKMLDSWLLGSIVAWGAKRKFNKQPIVFSLQQDLAKGKGTEVDRTIGEIVSLAKRSGREAPYNSLLIEMAREVEQRGAGKFFTREEVIDRFQKLSS